MTQTKVFEVEFVEGLMVIMPQSETNSFRYTDLHTESNRLMARLSDGSVAGVVFDLDGIDIVGSIMISAIIRLARRAGTGRAVFCSGSESMQETLRSMNLLRLWPHFETRVEALQTLAGV